MAPRKTVKKTAAAAPAKTTAKAVETTVTEKAAETKAVEVKETEKKAAPKKTCKTSLFVELEGLSVSIADIQTAVKKVVKEKGLDATELNIYVNAAEQAAYYTVDGEGGAEYKVDLKTL